jgi:hypothetical protein
MLIKFFESSWKTTLISAFFTGMPSTRERLFDSGGGEERSGSHLLHQEARCIPGMVSPDSISVVTLWLNLGPAPGYQG